MLLQRSRDVQRAFRARRVHLLATLQARVKLLEEENNALRARLGEGPRVDTPSEHTDDPEHASGDSPEAGSWDPAGSGEGMTVEEPGDLEGYSNQFDKEDEEESEPPWSAPTIRTSVAPVSSLPHHCSPSPSPSYATPPALTTSHHQMSQQQLAHQLGAIPSHLSSNLRPHLNLYTLASATSSRMPTPQDHPRGGLTTAASYDPNYPHAGTHFWPASFARSDVLVHSPRSHASPLPSPTLPTQSPSPTPDDERLFLATSCAIPITELSNPTAYHIFCLTIFHDLPITGKGRTGRLSLAKDINHPSNDNDNDEDCCGGLIDCSHALFEDDAPTSPVPEGYVSALTAWNLVSGIPDESGINISPRDLAALVLEATSPGGPESVRCERGHGLIVAERAIAAVRLVAGDMRRLVESSGAPPQRQQPPRTGFEGQRSEDEYDPFVTGMALRSR